MKTRFGLKPEEYKKEDIEFECVNKQYREYLIKYYDWKENQ